MFDRSKSCAIRANRGEWIGNCERCANGTYGCDRALAYEKTPQRTMRWVHLCTFIERQAGYVTNNAEKVELLSYCQDQLAVATAEGYDDTATYIQHVINDMNNRNYRE